MRRLEIDFYINKDVKYRFSRSSNKVNLNKYLIEHPINQVVIIDATPGYKVKRSSNGQVEVQWDKGDAIEERFIEYIKKEKLHLIQEDPVIYRYNEIIHINKHFLRIHKRDHKISAIKKKSVAVFMPQSAGIVHSCDSYIRPPGCFEVQIFNSRNILESVNLGWAINKIIVNEKFNIKPTELCGTNFDCKGIIEVDWYLECLK
jgi:hypothetical protein